MSLPQAETRKKTVILLAGILLVVGFGHIDYLTGIEIAFSVFYVLPIYLVTWFVGWRSGVVFALFSTIALMLADHLGPHDYSSPLVPVWNMAVRLTFFLITIYLISELQSKQRRKRELERIFFHDILNSIAAIRGFSEFLKESEVENKDEVYDLIYATADSVLEQIETQRAISAAEGHELVLHPAPVRSRELLEQAAALFRHHESARGRRLVLDPGAADVRMVTDGPLLARVLGNMIKNALEASSPGETVSVGCRQLHDSVEFWVHNPKVIPPEDQARIFRRSFSTKGVNRGLGTFSMKILSRYLGGKVSFSSTPESGTVFRAQYPLEIR